MAGFRQARSIANLPLTSFENAFNDDEFDVLLNLTVNNLAESISKRINSFEISNDSPSSILFRILDKQMK